MDRIIAGRFPTKSEADSAAVLIRQYADSADICIFHNNPPGQHDRLEVGDDQDSDRRPGGIMLSVRIATPRNEKLVIDTLRTQGAADIEQANGTWRDGDWQDFDPSTAPLLV